MAELLSDSRTSAGPSSSHSCNEGHPSCSRDVAQLTTDNAVVYEANIFKVGSEIFDTVQGRGSDEEPNYTDDSFSESGVEYCGASDSEHEDVAGSLSCA